MLISYPIVQPNKSITFKSVLLLILSIKVGSEYRYLDHLMRYKNIFVRFSGHDSFVTDGVLGMKLLNVIMTFVTKVICRIYVACYLLILSIKVGSEYRYLDHLMRYKNIFVRFSGHDSFVTDGVLGMKLLNVIMTFVTKVICRIYVACYCQ